LARIRNVFAALEEGIISLLLASMTLLVFVEVVFRFVLHQGIAWAQELTLLLSGWLVLFGVSYGIKVGSHIGVDALVKILPPKARRLVSVVAVILCLAYCALFLVGGWTYIAKLMHVNVYMEDLPIPKWVASSIILIGMGLLALRLLGLLAALVRGEAERFQLLDEVKESVYLAHEEKPAGLEGDDE
jgi:C4-dicarboxylate transporter DctQ subunit